MRGEWLGVIGGALLVAPCAGATDPGLELSRDGQTWMSTLAVPVLDEDARLSPGGSTRADLWVRNASGRSTTVTVTTRAVSTLPRDVAARDDFRLRVADSRFTAARARGCRVVETARLGPGEAHRVQVVVALPISSREVSERASVAVPVEVHLVEGAAGDGCSASGDVPGGRRPTRPESPGVVQTDGGPGEDSLPADLLAAALLTVVAALGLRRRARGRSSPPAS